MLVIRRAEAADVSESLGANVVRERLTVRLDGDALPRLARGRPGGPLRG